MGVDEGHEVDRLLQLAQALQLLQLEAEELHQRAVLAVTQLVAVADGGGRDAHALGDVGLGDGAGDAVGIRVASQRDEEVLAFGYAERVGEAASALLRALVWNLETPYGFRHRALSWVLGTARAVSPDNCSCFSSAASTMPGCGMLA